MDDLCKSCKNRCKVTSYLTGRKVGEICEIRFDAGGDADPVNMSVDGLCCYYQMYDKTTSGTLSGGSSPAALRRLSGGSLAALFARFKH